jgi:hypothetical protein
VIRTTVGSRCTSSALSIYTDVLLFADLGL